MIISKFKVIQLSLLLLLFIGCSGVSGPNNTDAETAIKKSLKGEALPSHLKGGAYFVHEVLSVKEIKVIEIGTAQGEGTEQYWPVKVFVKCKCSVGISGGGRKIFEGETVFNVSEDGFGGWKAKHDRDYK